MLTGSILIIALLSGIPIYSQGVLQRVLTKNLESIQSSTDTYPGTVSISTTFGANSTASKIERQTMRIGEAVEGMKADLGLETLIQSKSLSSIRFIAYSDIEKNQFLDNKGVNIMTMSDFEEHIEITYGRMYQERDDGVVEVMLSAEAMAETHMLLDTEYELARSSWMRGEDEKPFLIEIVGVYTMADASDIYWTSGISKYDRVIFCGEDAFNSTVGANPDYVDTGKWNLSLNYYGITLKNADAIAEAFNTYSQQVTANDGAEVNWPVIEILSGFGEQQSNLDFSLIVIELPVILLLAFYIYMVSQLIMDTEANEIAVLKSRGASNWHIFYIFLLQGLIISAISMLIAPFIGLFSVFLLGGANGFLEFVNRSALDVSLSPKAYLYGLGAAAFFIFTMMLPAIKASRQTILTHKQEVARNTKKVFWKKFGLDFILIAISVYGLYSYYNQQEIIDKLSSSSSGSTVDPLMLLISTLFILGVGLLFLRIFPYIIRFIFFLGRRYWSPSFYLSLTQVGRSNGMEQFLMLFLIFTIGVSIFSANTARSINTNQEENLEYVDGADIVITNEWKYDLAYYNTYKPYGYTVYKEVDETAYEKLDGVDSATKVWKGTCNSIRSYAPMPSDDEICVMGIVPNEFAETAQMRNGLTPYHWYNYCNLLTDYDNVILLSSEFKDYGLNVGDYVSMSLGEGSSRLYIIGSFIDYWPSINVNDTIEGTGSHLFAVVAFDSIFTDEFDLPVQPYQIWINKADGVTSNHIYEQIEEQNLQIDARKDLTEDTVSLKNDPTLQSLNGALTLCFITSLIICFTGFLIYWIIAIKKRVLQFGIIRAIGMRLRSLIGMLVLEQVLISGSAVIAGIFIGILTSYYYIPIYSMTQSSSELLLPFRIVSMPEDYIRLYIILAIILIIGFIILANLIKRIKISQALKIGED